MLSPTCANRSDLERERKTERLNSIATELEIHRQGLNTQLAQLVESYITLILRQQDRQIFARACANKYLVT